MKCKCERLKVMLEKDLIYVKAGLVMGNIRLKPNELLVGERLDTFCLIYNAIRKKLKIFMNQSDLIVVVYGCNV
jgi:hypothetical protein